MNRGFTLIEGLIALAVLALVAAAAIAMQAAAFSAELAAGQARALRRGLGTALCSSRLLAPGESPAALCVTNGVAISASVETPPDDKPWIRWQVSPVSRPSLARDLWLRPAGSEVDGSRAEPQAVRSGGGA